MGTVLRVEGLSHCYANGWKAIEGIDFSLEEGETVALLGANGSGKTTFLLHLNGLLRGEGRIEVGGELLTGESVARIREMVGLVFQDSDDQLFMPTVWEDVAFGLRQRGVAIAEARERATGMLERLGIGKLAERAPHQLSAGEKKRVAVAGVLILEPKILVLDEPTEGIQPSIIKDIGRVIRMLAGRGDMAILLCEQYYDFAEELADDYLVMERGEVIATGPGSEMQSQGIRQLVSI